MTPCTNGRMLYNCDMNSAEQYRGLCPNIAPLDRILALANIALDKEEGSRSDHAKVSIGKRSASIFSRDHQFMYHIEQELTPPEIRLNLSIFALNHLSRYMSTDDNYSISSKYGFHKLQKKNNTDELSPETHSQITSRWLMALTASDPEYANELLNTAIDKKFPATVGSFLLSASDIADQDPPAKFIDFGKTSPRKITNEFVKDQRGVEHDAIRDLVADHPEYLQSFAVKHFQAQNAVNSPKHNNLKVGDVDRLMIVTESMLAISDEIAESKHDTKD